jgi:hypothetical protein
MAGKPLSSTAKELYALIQLPQKSPPLSETPVNYGHIEFLSCAAHPVPVHESQYNCRAIGLLCFMTPM